MTLSVIILAAGKGKRMNSDKAKVLHPVGGKPMLGHVLETADQMDSHQNCVVYGHDGENVQAAFADHDNITWVHQTEQLGTGHAVAQALPFVDDNHTVLVMYGDVPLIRPETLHPLLKQAEHTLTLLTACPANPFGYGRIVRDIGNHVQAIIEEKDATPDQRLIGEINTGFLAAPAPLLKRWVNNLSNDNRQGEYYLTDIVAMAVADGVVVETVQCPVMAEAEGANDRKQLAALERHYQRRQVDALMAAGVTVIDPERLDIRGQVETGKDVVIDVNVILEGHVKLGNGVTIGANTIIKNAQLDDGCQILSHCHVEGARIGKHVQSGPFARLRPDTVLADEAKIGNFVEVKKATVGTGSKVNHLAYIGDTEIGTGSNIGAGTITCNYDGANKHKTIIGNRVFIGSNAALVAPVKIGDGATVGAGSTIRKDIPAENLGLARARQRLIDDWKRPVKK